MSELTQQSKILKMLRKAGSKGVPNYKFPQNQILRYSSRIRELRQDGYDIQVERQLLKNGRYSNVFIYYLNEES